MVPQLKIIIVLALTLQCGFLCPLAIADQAPSIANFQQLLADFSSTDNEARSNSQSIWQNVCFELGKAEHDAIRRKACEQMCASLSSEQPRDSALFLLRQLERIGRDESVSTLQLLINSSDPVIADAARRALQTNPADSAHDALVALLDAATNDDLKVNLIHSLGYRAESKSLLALVKHLEKGTPTIQISAANALSRLDSVDAAAAVFSAWQTARSPLSEQLAGTLIACANRAARQGHHADAHEMFRAVYGRVTSPAVRAASLKGQLTSAGDESIELMVQVLNRTSVLEQQVVIGHVSELEGTHIASLIANLSKVPPAGRASLLFALGTKREQSALPTIEQACQSEDLEVRIAAISALGHVGSAAHTQPLLDLLSGEEAVREAAMKSLSMIFDDEVDTLLLQRLARSKDGEQRETLISILSARSCPALADVIVDSNALVSPNAETRKRATGILNRLGTQEHVSALIASMVKIPASEHDNTAKTIVNICSRIPSGDEQAAPVVNMYATAAIELRPYLLSVAGRIGGKAAGDFIGNKVASPSATEKDAAITALCNWPDDAVSNQLLAIAKSGDTPAQRSRAIRAIARVVVLPSSKHTLDQQLSILQQTMNLATHDDERQLILDRAKAIGLLSTVEWMRLYLNSPTLGEQAASSLVHLARIRELRQADPSLRMDLQRVVTDSLDAKLRERAKQFLLEY